MNPIELALKKIQAAQQNPQGNSEIWLSKEQAQSQQMKLPEQKFQHFEVHPVMKDFWKTAQENKNS